jgi:hypothetical protein
LAIPLEERILVLMIKVVDTRDDAVRLYETFTARGHRRDNPMDFGWPEKLQRVGLAVAELYRSNKWKSDLKNFEDYKHIAETPHKCHVVPGFLRERGNPERALKVHGPVLPVGKIIGSPAPQHFAILAPLLGIQIHLDGPSGRPMHEEDGLFEISVAHAHLGACRTKDGRAFLFVYTRAGVHMIITGDRLTVEADGIAQ